MIQFDDLSSGSTNPHCIACEELLADVLDGTLGSVEQTFFDRHIQTCSTCSHMFADAQRGAAWLELLRTPRPEPSQELLERILAETSGAETFDTRLDLLPTFVPLVPVTNVLAFRPHRSTLSRTLLEPRLAMTAAMAFFSIALTFNLMGFRLSELRASDLTPTGIRHSFYQESAEAVRYYDNLRVVHVVESRVEDLRQQNADLQLRRQDHSAEPETEPQESKPSDAPKDGPGPGTSQRQTPPVSGIAPVLASMLLWTDQGGLV